MPLGCREEGEGSVSEAPPSKKGRRAINTPSCMSCMRRTPLTESTRSGSGSEGRGRGGDTMTSEYLISAAFEHSICMLRVWEIYAFGKWVFYIAVYGAYKP